MPRSENEPNQMAFAFGWVARMTTVVLEMALPGLGGQWLDSLWGTNYWVLVGFGLGFAVGIFHLMQMVKQHGPKDSPPNNDPPSQPNH
jgi:F0F1-type ATP synthase assembly protein I